MVRYLPPEAHTLVQQARSRGLLDARNAPSYLSPGLCTPLALLLAVPTFGYSLLFVPIVWVAQHERTNHRLERLRRQLERSVASGDAAPSGAAPEPASSCRDQKLPAVLA